MSSDAWEKTYEAVEGQLSAMDVENFEVGVLQRGGGDKPQYMLLRTWDQRTVIQSIPWLRYQNCHASHIYVRPKGESSLTLVDDLILRADATIDSHWSNRVVPVWQGRMWLDAKAADVLWIG